MRIVKLALAAAIASVAGHASAEIFTTPDAPVAIPDNSDGAITACQDINVPDSIIVSSIAVETAITHTWVGDVTIQLESPAGTVLTIMNRPGRNATGFGPSTDLASGTPLRFSDAAQSGVSAEQAGVGCTGAQVVGLDCPPDNFLSAPDPTDTPIAGVGTSFADFDGEDAQGTWTLCVADSASGDTGTLTSWSLGVNDPVPVELMEFSID